MVKLANKKRKWAIDNVISGRKTIQEAAEIYNISERWIQILVRFYKSTGAYPMLNRMRRPKTELKEEEQLIEKAVRETGLTNIPRGAWNKSPSLKEKSSTNKWEE